MGWLTRIKDSLLSKIKKKIPKKDLENVEKSRKEKIEVKKKNLKVTPAETPAIEKVKRPKSEKKGFFGLFKKKESPEQSSQIKKDP